MTEYRSDFDPSPRHTRRRDFILVTLWIFVTFKQFRFDELILYPLALYFACAFVVDFKKIFPLIQRNFILFLFPVWCLLSALWGVETEQILRSGLQLTLTIMICFTIATRLTARDLILALTITATYFAVMSFLAPIFGTGTPARGVFPSKNAMGGAMVILWLCSLCIILDRQADRKLKMFAVATTLLAVWQIRAASSATAALLAIGILALVLLFAILPRSGLLNSRVFFFSSALLLAVISFWAASFLSIHTVDPINSVLGAFNKDTTLTGRTLLWDYATRQIEQQPLLGVGAGGFWTPYDKLSEASRIYQEFYKAPYAKFSFHNSYFEVAVHQGLVGLAIVIATVCWVSSSLLFPRIQTGTTTRVFFLCVSAILLAKSMTESDLLTPFSLLTTLFVTGGLMMSRTGATQSSDTSPPSENFVSVRKKFGPIGSQATIS